TELVEGVDGRHDAAAAAAPVKVFAAIEKLQVVTSSLAINTHCAVAADRRKTSVVLDAGCSRRQSEQFIQASGVGGELTYLLAGDQVTDLAGIRLHRSRGRFNGDRLLRVADLKSEVDARTISNCKDQA